MIRLLEGRHLLKEESGEEPERRAEDLALRAIFKSYPKIRKLMERRPWTQAQKFELLKVAVPETSQDAEGMFRHLPGTLLGMEEVGWGYDQQFRFLQRVAERGDFPKTLHYYLPKAFRALNSYRWLPEESFELFLDLAERGGPNVDRVFSNLSWALRAMRENGWEHREQVGFLQLFVNYSGYKVGTALANLPGTMGLLRLAGWNFAQQTRFLVLLAERAPDELHLSWMMEEYLPAAVDMMRVMNWDAAEQSRLLNKMLAVAGDQAPRALELFPGLVHTMLSLGWPHDYAYLSLLDLFDASGPDCGKMVSMAPMLLRTMKNQELGFIRQREILSEVAEQVGYSNELALMNFTLKLIHRPIYRTPS